MPSQFGSVFRSFVRKDPTNNLGVQLYLITRNSVGQLSYPSSVIKNNIETYIKNFKSFSDTVRISDGRVINIGVNFTVVPNADANEAETLMECILVLQRIFDTTRTNFNDSVIIPEIQGSLQSLQKVRAVPHVGIFNRVGTVNGNTYSGTEFNIKSNTSSGIVKFPVDAVWELKYPNFDIIGRPADQSTAAAGTVAGGGGGGY
tara:strand:- start:28 stop:636 length:609 start_codon:yes stop_codon:yes gene_type:complete